jgi:DNA-binding response OmpR family regulator
VKTDAERITALEDRVAVLEEALGLTYKAPVDWGLSAHQTKLLGIIARSPVASHERIYTALYGDRADPPGMTAIKTLLVHIRRRLARHGVPVQINTIWGVGYSMAEADRKRLLGLKPAETEMAA